MFKTVLITENVFIPNKCGFKKGIEVSVSEEMAELLVTRKHAKYIKDENKQKVLKKKTRQEVTIRKNNI